MIPCTCQDGWIQKAMLWDGRPYSFVNFCSCPLGEKKKENWRFFERERERGMEGYYYKRYGRLV